MTGARLAAAALTAAACAWRAPSEFAVLSFAREVQVHRALTAQLDAGVVVERLLQLRGHGVTALATALRAAGEQLAGRAGAAAHDDPAQRLPRDRRRGSGAGGRRARRAAGPGPGDDSSEAAAFAASAGARWEPMAGAADAPAALARLLDG